MVLVLAAPTGKGLICYVFVFEFLVLAIFAFHTNYQFVYSHCSFSGFVFVSLFTFFLSTKIVLIGVFLRSKRL